MSAYLNSTTLVETILRESLIPSNQATFTTDDFLAMANQETRIGLVPSILQYHQEYFVIDTAPIPLVANQQHYPIPYRALGSKIRDIYYMDSSNNLRLMTRINPEDRPYYQQTNSSVYHQAFYLQNNDIVMVPEVTDNPTGSLLIAFFIRPNDLVDMSLNRTALITGSAIVGDNTVFTVDRIPSGQTPFIQNGQVVTAFTTSTLVDIMQTKPGHKILNYDMVPSAVDTVGLTITFPTASLNEQIALGDYISFAGECIIPNVPTDLHDVLSQRVVQRCLQALGDQEGYGVATAKLKEMNAGLGTLMSNRSEGNPIKIVNRNGVLRGGGNNRRWGF